jgi:hypothetical protein
VLFVAVKSHDIHQNQAYGYNTEHRPEHVAPAHLSLPGLLRGQLVQITPAVRSVGEQGPRGGGGSDGERHPDLQQRSGTHGKRRRDGASIEIRYRPSGINGPVPQRYEPSPFRRAGSRIYAQTGCQSGLGLINRAPLPA